MIFAFLNKYKKTLFAPFILAGLMLILPQSGVTNTQNYEYEIIPTKMIFGNVGYGPYDLSLALGGRYWLFGLSIGLAGFTKSLPPYRKDTILREDRISVTERYTTLIVNVDASGYYDISEKVSIFGSLGFYSQKDTILARPHDIQDPNLYRYKEESKWGVAIGIGAQYFFEEDFSVGLGYHSKNGFYAQLGYWW